MLLIRTWHTHLGVFIAPSVLFFCFTGAFQLFSLHEAHGKYRPPAILEKLAKLHKDQVFEERQHEAEPSKAEASQEQTPPPEEAEDEKRVPTMILKSFFVVVAVSLMASTILGLWMALVNPRRRRRYWLLLAAGTAVPAVLALL
jgi:hypothetical protein